MKKPAIFLCALLVIGLAVSTPPARAGSALQVEVLYMNHGPMQPTIKSLKDLFATYNDQLEVAWHDFQSADGETFMAGKGIHEHVPLMIWINGQNEVMVSGTPVAFAGFPSGAGPAMFQGKWDFGLLKQALDQALAAQ